MKVHYERVRGIVITFVIVCVPDAYAAVVAREKIPRSATKRHAFSRTELGIEEKHGDCHEHCHNQRKA